MKQLVRPIIIEEPFNSLEELQGDIILRNGNLYTCDELNTLQQHEKQIGDKVMQLVLVSLDPSEKIVQGDDVYRVDTKTLHKAGAVSTGFIGVAGTGGVDRSVFSKVIAQQSQIPPEYIQRFINEYNKGNAQDVEIEMFDEYFNDTPNNPGQPDYDWNNTPSDLCGFRLKPKLVNNSIIIHKSCNTCIHRIEDKNCFDFCEVCEPYTKEPIIKEPILYTEQEVKRLCSKAALVHFDNDKLIEEFDKWFDKNKKN